MVDQIFHVATEFKFDIGSALLNTKALTDQVDALSASADGALNHLNYLAGGLVARMGMGSGGLMAVISKAVMISDKFNSSALSFSNIISSNMKAWTGPIDTFNGRLEVSKQIMDSITHVANQFALPSGELMNMTKLTAPLLAVHGMAGTNMKNAIDLSKNVLKSAPNLGIDPHESEGQLLRAIGGQAGMHDTLFRRLMTDTTAFKDAKITNSGQFNAMNPEKRITLLSKALSVFASDADVLKNRVDSLSGQLTILSNNVMEFGSVLRPIGDAILKPVVIVLKELNRYIDNEGRQMAKSVGALITSIFEDPKALLINLLQFKELGRDTRKGAKLMGLIEFVSLLNMLRKFAPLSGALNRVFSAVFGGIMSLAQLIPWGAVFTFLGQAVSFVLTTVLPRMFLAVTAMQILSRAAAKAKVEDVQALAAIAPKYGDLMVRMKNALENIFLPLTEFIDFCSDMVKGLFKMSNWAEIGLPIFEMFIQVLEVLGEVVVRVYAGFMTMLHGLFQILANVDNFMNGKKSTLGLFDGVKEEMDRTLDGILNKYLNRSAKGDGIAQTIQNIGKVEIRNDFKENQEPDRIAFTIREQLMKATKNKTQGRGSSMQNAFAE